MPSIDDIFAGRYLKAEDLQGKRTVVTISDVSRQDFDNGPKLVLALQGKDKEFVANKTNCMVIAEAFGKDYDRWVGHRIEIYPERVPFQGKMVPSIRCKPVREQEEAVSDEEIPF